MHTFIDKMIHKVFDDFQEGINQREGLCELKDLTYKGRNLPDYENELIQQYYMLRFFPAYLAEYYLIYRKLFRKRFIRSPLNIFSIGVGCGIDYYGLHFAAKDDENNRLKNMEYTGIDQVDWLYWNDFGRKNIHYIVKDITKWSKLDEDSYNIIIFPKSIGEFSNKTFTHIKNIFRNSTFSAKRIYFLCSLMDVEYAKGVDIGRLSSLVDIMKRKHGFSCQDDPEKFWRLKKDAGIITVCNGFMYPDDIIDELRKLLERCPTYISNGNESCESNCANINRYPILRTKYMNYSILRLEKK
ncbi:MAG: hypothetical protein E3J72_18640 [Planctomycetota bacterium]|nr:MAG: hypothetical protein E3J72_18640 [Planctomycetota bacterium]